MNEAYAWAIALPIFGLIIYGIKCIIEQIFNIK